MNHGEAHQSLQLEKEKNANPFEERWFGFLENPKLSQVLLRTAEQEMARRLRITSTFQVLTIIPIFIMGVLRRPDIWILILFFLIGLIGASLYTWILSSQIVNNSSEQPKDWSRRIFLGVFSSGVIWGGCSCIFLHLNSKDLLSSIIVVFLAAANCSAAVTTFVGHWRTGVTYLGLFLGIPFLYCLINYSKLNLTIASFLVLFFTYLLSQMRVHYKEFIESLVEGQQVSEKRNQAAQIIRNLDQQISEREKIEERLINTREEALELTRAKSEFLANMSHEIRTPMNGILGMTEILFESGLNSVQQNQVQIIQECGSQLLRTINDLLDFSKLEAHKMELEKVPFQLPQILERVKKGAQGMAAKKSISLDYHISDEVPLSLIGDSNRLQQIISHLVDNAIKFTELGGVNIEVTIPQNRTVSSFPDKSEILFSILDTGIGIPKARLYGIFEAFSQLDSSTSRKYGGTGLGLAIAKKLVGLMDGEIWAESLLGIGSTFNFTIQAEIASSTYLRAQEEEASLRRIISDSSENKVFDFSKIRLLLVEDNIVNQTIIKKLLDKMGVVADLAESGEVAVEKAFENKYDLILMDLQLPGISGFEAARLIHNERNREGTFTKIVALTAGLADGEDADLKSSGICSFILKPISADRLKEHIESCFQRKFHE